MSGQELYETAKDEWFFTSLWSPELEAALRRFAQRIVETQ